MCLFAAPAVAAGATAAQAATAAAAAQTATMMNAMLAISAASAGASYHGQGQAAKAQTRYQQQMMEAEQARQVQEESNLRLRQQNEQEARTRELAKVSQEGRAMYSRNVTAAGEAGISGASVDALLAEGTRRELDFYESMDRQGRIQDTTYEREIAAGRSGSEMRILDVNRPVSRPSFGGLAIDVGAGVMQAQDFGNRHYQIGAQSDTAGNIVANRPSTRFTN